MNERFHGYAYTSTRTELSCPVHDSALPEETLGGEPVVLMDEGTFNASGHYDFTSVFATQGAVLARLGRFASQVSKGEGGDHWSTMRGTPVFVGDEVHVAERWSVQQRTGDAGSEHLSVRRWRGICRRVGWGGWRLVTRRRREAGSLPFAAHEPVPSHRHGQAPWPCIRHHGFDSRLQP